MGKNTFGLDSIKLILSMQEKNLQKKLLRNFDTFSNFDVSKINESRILFYGQKADLLSKLTVFK